MSMVEENWNLIFYAEGDDAAELIDLMDEEDEATVIDQVTGGKLDEVDEEDVPEPEEDDEVHEHEDGYVLIYNRPMERVWIYELSDFDEDL